VTEHFADGPSRSGRRLICSEKRAKCFNDLVEEVSDIALVKEIWAMIIYSVSLWCVEILSAVLTTRITHMNK
jgi:hypothetical protein